MTFRTHTIVIVGAGQLGSRYLQGLIKCSTRLRIYVQDVSKQALLKAEHRWNEVNGPFTHHIIFFVIDIERFPQQLDLAIIATTADSRPDVVRKIIRHSQVRYWILEKVLAQSTEALHALQLYVGSDSLAWVNTPRRSLPWHKRIREQLNLKIPLRLIVEGGPWGLACNAMHFLDVMAWWSGENLESVCTDHLDDKWFPAKRAGSWEICGTLTANFSGGSTAKLISVSIGEATYLCKIVDANGTWCIDEENGTAIYTDGLEIPGRLPFQSEMTSALVDEILGSGRCLLPTLNSSVSIHRIFIDAMLDHWRAHQDPSATFIPIT